MFTQASGTTFAPLEAPSDAAMAYIAPGSLTAASAVKPVILMATILSPSSSELRHTSGEAAAQVVADLDDIPRHA